MELVIELAGRGSRHFDFQKVSGEVLTIGRSFENDVVLTDPHVCAKHAVIEADAEGNLILRDLGSLNGLQTGKHEQINGQHQIESGDEFILGKTRMRIYQPHHPVEATVRLYHIEKVFHVFTKAWLALPLALLALFIQGYSSYNSSYHELKTLRFISEMTWMLILMVIWPLAWSIYARIKKHESRFMAQLGISSAFLSVVALVTIVANWLMFHSSENSGIGVYESMIFVVLLLLLIWSHFYLSSFHTRKRRWLNSVMLTVLISGMYYVISTNDHGNFRHAPEYFTKLYPPGLTVYSTVSNEEYLKAADELFAKVSKQLEKKDD